MKYGDVIRKGFVYFSPSDTKVTKECDDCKNRFKHRHHVAIDDFFKYLCDDCFNKKVNEVEEEQEKGEAEMKICLTDGEIKVYHCEGPLLFEKKAKKGDWDKIWEAIKK